MTPLLYTLGILSFLACLTTFAYSKGILHEIVAMQFALFALIALIGGRLVSLRTQQLKLQQQQTEMHMARVD